MKFTVSYRETITSYLIEQSPKSLQLCLELSIVLLEDLHACLKPTLVLAK